MIANAILPIGEPECGIDAKRSGNRVKTKHMKPLLHFLLATWLASGALGALPHELIHVVGDVPSPRTIKTGEQKVTMHAAVALAGLDLTPFYTLPPDGENAHRCPIRIVRHNGMIRLTYNPVEDREKLLVETLDPTEMIQVTDFRQHPEKIAERERRIQQMLELGSSEIGDEIRRLATLRHELAAWADWQPGKEPEEVDAFLQREAARLVDEGFGKKIIGLIELRRSALILDGLGPVHPHIKDTDEMLWMFIESHGPVID